ncbi:MFS transporter [Haoranjiania flava]|uniref:MFS transporter n=1 Tax=Haoranjiania flava TaxID=1856322 RepID=UPI0036302D54
MQQLYSMKAPLWNKNFIQVSLANFLMACSFNLLMPTIPLYITEQLHVEQTKTGIVLASYAIALMLTRPFSGYLVDVFSKKKILVICFALYTLTFGGYFFATSVLLFVIVRFFHGLWWGGGTVASSTIAVDVLPASRRAEGIGYFGTFNNVAMAVGPFIAIYIYQAYNFHVLLWCAISMGTLGTIAGLFITTRKRKPIEHKKIALQNLFLLNSWPIFLNQLFPTFAWGTIGPFVAQYGKQLSVPNAGIFFIFWAGGIIMSRIFSGKFVDRGYIHTVNIAAMFTVAASFLVFALFHNIIAFCASGLFIGVGYGMMFPAMQTLYINMSRPDQRGTANSTYLLGFDLGLALGMLIGGVITGLLGFSQLYIVSATLCVLGIICYWFISRRVYNKYKMV